MPQFDTKTTAVEFVWKSPDGAREINKVTLDYEGKSVQAKTFSKDIATVGWEGTVETYEKPGKGDYPPETYVKQPPKEGFTPQPTAPSAGKDIGRGSGGGKPSFDNFTMYLSYAKDLAIACLNFSDNKGVFDDTLYGELLGAVEAGGAQLYEGRPGAYQVPQGAPAKPADKPAAKEMPKDFLKKEEPEQEQVDMSQLSAMLGDIVKEDEEENPWSKSS